MSAQMFIRRSIPALRARGFASTAFRGKSATEAAKDTLKSADRTVSDQLVKGINKGCEYLSCRFLLSLF